MKTFSDAFISCLLLYMYCMLYILMRHTAGYAKSILRTKYTLGVTNSSSAWWNKAHHVLLNDSFDSIEHLRNGWNFKYTLSNFDLK